MFSSLKQRLLLGLYVFLILSIPVGAFLASKQQNSTSKATGLNSNPSPTTTPHPTPKVSSASAKIKLLADSTPTPDSSLPTTATSFGPTLSLKAALEGRPATNQATKLFVGIIEGDLTSSPKFILSFSINLPASGAYSNLSLAGLSVGSRYTALLKGAAQIATASSFVVSPNVSNLNNGQVINLTSGDLNEDNIINASDYAIVKKAFGSTPTSSNWNQAADFNKDGVINVFDLSLVSKNLGTTGSSGVWTSPIPQVATQSASLNSNSPPVGGPASSAQGYWVWMPQ